MGRLHHAAVVKGPLQARRRRSRRPRQCAQDQHLAHWRAVAAIAIPPDSHQGPPERDALVPGDIQPTPQGCPAHLPSHCICGHPAMLDRSQTRRRESRAMHLQSGVFEDGRCAHECVHPVSSQSQRQPFWRPAQARPKNAMRDVPRHCQWAAKASFALGVEVQGLPVRYPFEQPVQITRGYLVHQWLTFVSPQPLRRSRAASPPAQCG